MTGQMQKLEQRAGDVHADTGLDITVKPSNYTVDGVVQDGFYDVRIVGVATLGPCSYPGAHAVMQGITVGYRAAKREVIE